MSNEININKLIKHLSFEDFVDSKEFENTDWIVIARSINNKPNSFYTFSVLGKATKIDKQKKVVSSFEWHARTDFGKPY